VLGLEFGLRLALLEDLCRLAVDMDIHGYIHGYPYPRQAYQTSAILDIVLSHLLIKLNI